MWRRFAHHLVSTNEGKSAPISENWLTLLRITFHPSVTSSINKTCKWFSSSNSSTSESACDRRLKTGDSASNMTLNKANPCGALKQCSVIVIQGISTILLDEGQRKEMKDKGIPLPIRCHDQGLVETGLFYCIFCLWLSQVICECKAVLDFSYCENTSKRQKNWFKVV